jgi:tRNA threonylcarbamoyladenosine biosynthesis protein TsaB
MPEAIILHIDTATQLCSVALSKGVDVLSYRESFEKNAHAKNITLFIDEVVKEAGIELKDLDAISVSKGPGSYTGLRIGVSTAKGLCFALNKPLVSVGTLQAMASGAAVLKPGPQVYCPMIDARRMEVYSALFDGKNTKVREIKAEIIDENSFVEELEKGEICFFGDGAEKSKEHLASNPNAVFLDGFYPSAKYLIDIALRKMKAKQFEDIAYFEPFYLKDFIAGKPRVKGLK